VFGVPAIILMTAYCQLISGEGDVPLRSSLIWAVATAASWLAFAGLLWRMRGPLLERVERSRPEDLVEAAGLIFLTGLVVAIVSTGVQWSLIGYDLIIENIARRLFRLSPVIGLVALAVTAVAVAFKWRSAHASAMDAPAAVEAEPAPPIWIELPEAPRLRLRSEEVALVRTARNYCEFPVGGRELLVRITAKQLEERLAPHGFLRVHRSALVNLSRVTAVEPDCSGRARLLLDDGSTLSVSRAYRKQLDARLGGGLH
jgi:hypothetical protein